MYPIIKVKWFFEIYTVVLVTLQIVLIMLVTVPRPAVPAACDDGRASPVVGMVLDTGVVRIMGSPGSKKEKTFGLVFQKASPRP